MLKTTRKFMIVLSILFAFALALTAAGVSAQAQQDVSLASLEVDFWPEYDRPEMLVIYRVELDPSVNLPVDLRFRIPAHVGIPHAVAAGQTNDSLFTVTAERQVDGEWAYISFNTAMPIVRLEYYDPELSTADANRRYEFTWSGDYAVNQLLLQVQQPCEASNMVISPSLGSGVAGSDSLIYYSNTFGSLNQGQEFDLTISYTKTSDCLTISTLDVGAELPADTPGRARPLAVVLPYILGLLGVLLIVGGVVWYWQSGRQQPMQAARTSRSRRSANQASGSVADNQQPESGAAVYCHNCGKRANASDKFCRSCGTRLRAP